MWTFQPMASIVGDDPFKEAVYALFLEGFQRGPVPRDIFEGWYASCLRNAHIVGTLPDGQGVGFLSMPEADCGDGPFLWVDGICLRTGNQTAGAGGAAVRDAVRYLGRTPTWLGGRTQSPYFLRLLQKFGPTRPMDGDYADAQGDQLAAFMGAHIGQLNGLPVFHRDTGVTPRAYALALYPPNLDNVHFVPRYDPEAGDAVVCVCRPTVALG